MFYRIEIWKKLRAYPRDFFLDSNYKRGFFDRKMFCDELHDKTIAKRLKCFTVW